MTRPDFEACIARWQETIEAIRQSAFNLHASVNQTYDGTHPYSLHLQMVADGVLRYGHSVCACADDVLPIVFGAYFHDSIEDARLTYNDVTRIASRYMTTSQAQMAAEIVYALTNDKGRTRAERAGERYYQGIRTTPYAPLVKLADRLANTSYSASHANEANRHMQKVYANEFTHFMQSIRAEGDDPRMALPRDMADELACISTGQKAR